MSRQFRYRVTAIVLGGLIFGAPMLANGTASADLVEGGRQVTFSGEGMLSLSCRSQPDIESMVVPADSTVRVVNRTGYSAKLQLGGDTKGTLADDAATEVVFRRGTTAVALKPNCALGDDATPVLVTAAPSASAAMPDPIPAPTGGQSDAATVAPSGSGRPAGVASGSTLPDSVAPADRPTRVTPAGTRKPAVLRTSAVAQAASAAVQAMPDAGATSRLKTKPRTKTLTRTPDGGASLFAGMPPGDEKAVVPGTPRVDVPATTQAPPVVDTPPVEVAAAEPVAAMEPMRDGGPIGLLALTAAVCVLGVGTAAIRSIVSQRANRATIA
jgi:hypothetical protein